LRQCPNFKWQVFDFVIHVTDPDFGRCILALRGPSFRPNELQ
jgi:hypothetical protein